MVPLYTPETESEASVISGLLEAYQISFFIRGGAFGKLYPGVHISPFNTQTFMVSKADLEFALGLITDFVSDSSIP